MVKKKIVKKKKKKSKLIGFEFCVLSIYLYRAFHLKEIDMV